MHGNVNFVWNKIKDKEKFPQVFHKQLYLHGIFPSIERKKNTDQQGNTGGGWWFKSHLQHLLCPCIQTIIEYNRIEYLFPSTILQNELVFNKSSKCARLYKVHGLENSFYPEFRGPVT